MIALRKLWIHVEEVFAREGAGGIARRTAPFLWRTAKSLPGRLRLKRGPRATLVVLTHPEVIADVVEALERGNLRPSRLFQEIVVLTYGGDPPNSKLAPSRKVRWYNTPERDPVIAANTAAALAHGRHIGFCTDPKRPGWTDFNRRLLRGSGSPEVVCRSEVTLDRGDPDLSSVELDEILLDRRALIVAGMFRPETGDGFVAEAVERMWKGGYRFLFMRGDRAQFVTPPPVDQPSLPRVVYYVNGTDIRGGIRIVFEHVNRLRERGIETFVVSFEEPLQTWFPGLKAPLIRSGEFLPADVGVATFWTTAPHVALLDCARFYFIQHDEALFHIDDWWENEVRKTYKLPLEFITIATWLTEHIRKHAGKEAVLVPNGINRQMFYPEPAYPRTGKVRVLVEGDADIFWKGLEEAKAALRSLDVEVWCLGNTGIGGDRIFEYPPQDELRRIYSSCDILLKTSWYEGMPLPHMEAMACGCALLTTDVPGVRDYCVDGYNCLMAEVKSVPDIREKLVRLIEDHELRAKLIENGLRTADEAFNWDDKIDILEDLYRKGADQARRRFAQPDAPSGPQ